MTSFPSEEPACLHVKLKSHFIVKTNRLFLFIIFSLNSSFCLLVFIIHGTTEFLFMPLFSGCVLNVGTFSHKLYLSEFLRHMTHIFCFSSFSISRLSYGMCRLLLIHDKYKEAELKCFQTYFSGVTLRCRPSTFLFDLLC